MPSKTNLDNLELEVAELKREVSSLRNELQTVVRKFGTLNNEHISNAATLNDRINELANNVRNAVSELKASLSNKK